MMDGHWTRAQYLELTPQDQSAMVPLALQKMAAKESDAQKKIKSRILEHRLAEAKRALQAKERREALRQQSEGRWQGQTLGALNNLATKVDWAVLEQCWSNVGD